MLAGSSNSEQNRYWHHNGPKRGNQRGAKVPPIGLGEGLIYPWLFWYLWTARNNAIFWNRIFSIEDTISKALVEAKEWSHNQTKLAPTQLPGVMIQQYIVAENAITCNTDAAWREDTKAAGYGWVFRTGENRELLRGSKTGENIQSPILAESQAIVEALSIAKQRGWRHIAILSDAL